MTIPPRSTLTMLASCPLPSDGYGTAEISDRSLRGKLGSISIRFIIPLTRNMWHKP